MRPVFEAVDKDELRGLWIVKGKCYNDDGTPMVNEDGEHYGYQHHFPLDTLEWRAAEYEIDPSDTAKLLDIVLTEPFITPDDYADDAPNLYDTDDVSEARAGHIARCARVKLRHRISRGDKQHPLRRVEHESPISQQVVNIKTAVRKKNRQDKAMKENKVSPLNSDQQRMVQALSIFSADEIGQI